ncbi:hypothetical protein [uncultured Desulfobacter sp.]|uniref:hypothetical protein n=1 Tax=uncultured Desulfobacter sp. TaxID=240139 RepID=UPI002AABB913|nr:hypothetical protein [uncultured Desulfobacter sp.]
MTIRILQNVFGLISIFLIFPTIVWSQETVIAATKVGECELRVEVNDQWHTMRLRAFHPLSTGCDIGRESMLPILDEAFSKIRSPQLDRSYASLYLGRLIDYPWMCQYLANAARTNGGWDSRKGKPVAMDINKYVSSLLFRKELLAPIIDVLAKNGYSVTGVSVEKVLVGSFHDVPLYQEKMFRGRVPFDAQVWLRLEKG